MSIRLTAYADLEQQRRPGVLARIRTVAWHLFSFETLFVIFLFSVALKVSPQLAWLPVDLTQASFAASVAIGAIVLFRERIYLDGLNIVFFGSCFLFWAASSYGWSIGRVTALEKSALLLSFTFWCLIATSTIIANRPERVVRFMAILCLMSLLLAFDAVGTYLTATGAAFVGAIERAYLSYGRVMGMGAIVAFMVMVMAIGTWRVRLFGLAAFALLFFALFIGGGRGPLIAAALPLFLPLLIGVQVRPGRFLITRSQLWVVVGLAASVVGFLYVLTAGDSRLRTIGRLIGLFSNEDRLASMSGRLGYFQTALEGWWTAPVMGHGVGSFSILVFGSEIAGTYPHNLLLEVLVETGAVGFFLLVALFWVALRRVSFRRLRTEPLLLCAVMLLLNTMINAAVTSDLPGNRVLFAMLGLLAMRPPERAEDDDDEA